jgi:hypothetical protein
LHLALKCIASFWVMHASFLLIFLFEEIYGF